MKSNVSDYLEVAQSVYKDACAQCVTDVFDLRDLETIRSRVKHEGLSFLTITLPQFVTDFERSLANREIDSTLFASFRKNGAIPAFMQGMLSQLFDRRTGVLLPYTDETPTIVGSVRQIGLTFKKVLLNCSPARMIKAVESYKEIESTLHEFSPPSELLEDFLLISSMLWNDAIRPIEVGAITPKHSSGATADYKSGNQKYNWHSWHDRLEPYFPLIGSAFPLGIADSLEDLEKVTILPEDQEIPVRVILVPKTMKSPRVIAAEPSCMQYAQQGVLEALIKALKNYRFTKGHLNFDDQSVNRSLALTSSTTGQFATIDLSDASDRVPRDLALAMFDGNPQLRDAIEACRSRHALLPDGTIIGPLLKFASMGSALCFPVEAMYFYTICVIACIREDNLPVNSTSIMNACRGIYVYGDDIIVPTRYVTAVLDNLQQYNCKINTNKTFVSGSFRESCGMDAYAGYEVTPTYLHYATPKDRKQSDALVSWVATANLFYKRGYWLTARLMFKHIEKQLGLLPWLSDTSGGLGKTSFTQARTIERWNEKLHRFEVKAWTVATVYRTDKLDGFPALMKSFLHLDRKIHIEDAHHLEHTSMPHTSALKRAWVPSLS